MSNNFNQRFMESSCPTNACEEFNATVPITVRGITDIEDVSFNCIGPSIITRNSKYTPGSPNAVSRFTVSQRICVEIPILFGAEVEVGESHYEFASLAEKDSDRNECY